MKRLSLMVLLLLSVFATNVFAEGELNMWGGYTWGGYTRLSDVFQVDTTGGTFGSTLLSFNYFFGYNENVKGGFEVSNLLPDIKVSGGQRKASLSIMPGVKVNYDIGEKLSLNGKLLIGIALFGTSIGLLYVDCSGDVSNYRFVANASVGAQYLCTKKFGLGFDLGYQRLLLDPLVSGGVIKANYDISEEFSLNGKLFGGTVKTKTEYVPAADISVGAQYLFTKKVGLDLDLGYRFLPSRLSGFTAKLGLNLKE